MESAKHDNKENDGGRHRSYRERRQLNAIEGRVIENATRCRQFADSLANHFSCVVDSVRFASESVVVNETTRFGVRSPEGARSAYLPISYQLFK